MSFQGRFCSYCDSCNGMGPKKALVHQPFSNRQRYLHGWVGGARGLPHGNGNIGLGRRGTPHGSHDISYLGGLLFLHSWIWVWLFAGGF
jgi:hypothetical protein